MLKYSENVLKFLMTAAAKPCPAKPCALTALEKYSIHRVM